MKNDSSFGIFIAIFLVIVLFPQILFFLIVLIVIGVLLFLLKKKKSAQKSSFSQSIEDFFQKQKSETIDVSALKKSFSFSPHMNISPGKLLGLIIVGALILFMVVDGFVNVPPGYVAVLTDKGRGILKEELPVGLHLKLPFWQSSVLINTRLQTYTMSVSTNEGEIRGDDSIEALTKDGQKVNIDLTVQYIVDAKKANIIFSEVGTETDVSQKVIRPPVRDIVRGVITRYESKQLFSDASRQAIAERIETLLSENYKKNNIILKSALLRNIRFSDIYINAIEEKQIAEQKIQKAEFEKQEALIRKERTIIEAEADAEKIRLQGEALSKNPEVIQLEFVNKMAPDINWGILPDGAIPLLDIKNISQ